MSTRTLLDGLFLCCSTELTEDLQPSTADDGQRVAELGAPGAEQGQAGVDPVAPTMEGTPVVEPVAPAMEEQPAAGPSSPDGGAHDEGDPTDVSGGEEGCVAMGSSTVPAGAGMEAAGGVPDGAAQDSPTATEQATTTAAPVKGMGLEHLV